MLDEVPCNSDAADNWIFGKPSGNWTGLKSNGVNLMIALKPVENCTKGAYNRKWNRWKGQNTGVHLYFPEELEHLELCRIYRCTQQISRFYEAVLTKITTTLQINNSFHSFTPGHEILGEPPEVLMLPKCPCVGFLPKNCSIAFGVDGKDKNYCGNPQEHLLAAHVTKMFALLRRIQKKVIAEDEKITVIVDTATDRKKCVKWLENELEKNCISNVDVKTIEQCRGMELPTLVTITHGENIFHQVSLNCLRICVNHRLFSFKK